MPANRLSPYQSPRPTGLNNQLMGEILRTLEQSRVALEAMKSYNDHHSADDNVLVDRSLDLIAKLLPKLARSNTGYPKG